MTALQFEITHQKERMLVDGDHVNYGYRIDYSELTKSAFVDGDFYFFTCGCGEPGCAGINEPGTWGVDCHRSIFPFDHFLYLAALVKDRSPRRNLTLDDELGMLREILGKRQGQSDEIRIKKDIRQKTPNLV